MSSVVSKGNGFCEPGRRRWELERMNFRGASVVARDAVAKIVVSRTMLSVTSLAQRGPVEREEIGRSVL